MSTCAGKSVEWEGEKSQEGEKIRLREDIPGQDTLWRAMSDGPEKEQRESKWNGEESGEVIC
jgi:hypothetical protein